jgi:predicted alpha/beta hydrolase
MTNSTAQTLLLTTADDYSIAATYYPNSSDSPSPRAILVMAGATGVPQRFYASYSQTATHRGFDVITLDYRGIAASAPASLRGFNMQYLDWATQDLAAAVDYAQQKSLSYAKPVPIFLVGHSFGGHALGLLPNITHLQGAYIFGTGAGWHGWMPYFESLKVRFMWNIVAPIVVKAKGYLGWSILGMGEDLPLGVYRDWKHWCRFPHYFFDDPQMSHAAGLFARCQFDIVAANALDDKWAQPRSRDAFFSAYRKSNVIKKDLLAGDYGMSNIGHMGYFRKSASRIWEISFDWFELQCANKNI